LSWPSITEKVILNQLKGSGLVESKRGFYGGYFLVRQPNKIAVGEIMRFMERNQEQSQCVALVALWSATRNKANVLPLYLK
jgi:DNA-binding IscR family transcriptional regulator